MKLADKMREVAATGKPFFSFEFFPPRTEEVRQNTSFSISLAINAAFARVEDVTPDTLHRLQGVENLFDRQDRMASLGPLFCDITWGAGGTTADLTLDIANKMQNMVSDLELMAATA